MAILPRAVLIIAVLSVPVLSPAAETAKLRYVQSIYQDDKGIGVDHPEAVACS